MTVGWLLNIFGEDNRNVNKIQNPRPMEGSFSKPTTLFPILTGGFPSFPDYPLSPPSPAPSPPPPRLRPDDTTPGFHPFYKDAFSQDLNLPMLEPDYPAFFILVLLVTLTTFAMFVLLFLCCLDGDDLSPDARNGALRSLPADGLETVPEPEPPTKEVGTETDWNSDTAEDGPEEEEAGDEEDAAEEEEAEGEQAEEVSAEPDEGGEASESDADTVIEVVPQNEDLSASCDTCEHDDRIHVLSLNVYLDQSDPDLQQYQIIQDHNSKSMIRAYDYVNVSFNQQSIK